MSAAKSVPHWFETALTETAVAGAGADAESGWVYVELGNDGILGYPPVPTTRYIIQPKVAARLAVSILAAADPDLLLDLLRDRVAPRRHGAA